VKRDFLVLIVAVLLFAGIDSRTAEMTLANSEVQAFPLEM
jgi:hypothetical protein